MYSSIVLVDRFAEDTDGTSEWILTGFRARLRYRSEAQRVPENVCKDYGQKKDPSAIV